MTMFFRMSAPSPAAHVTKSRIGIRIRRRRPEPGDPRSWNLKLESAGTSIPLTMAAESPTLLVVAVEDLCWQLAADELDARRPHWWHRRARSAWRRDRSRLEDKRRRIAEMTADAVNGL